MIASPDPVCSPVGAAPQRSPREIRNEPLPDPTSHRRARSGSPLLPLGLFFAVLLALGPQAPAQTVESANAGRFLLWAGGGVSGSYVAYGEAKLVGATAWVDADTVKRFGLEGEGRWLEFNRVAGIHVENYLIGPRYHWDIGRSQPYVKALAGVGRFTFPYSRGLGSYAVLAAGTGVDYHLGPRWTARLDLELQDWPQFTFGAMNSATATLGIRYRIY